MENQIPFNEAMFMLANGWMTAWLYWMSFAITITPLVLIFSKKTRLDAVIVFVANMAMLWGMSWLYDQVGYVRLMGIVHVILWTPLFIYLVHRARTGEMPLACRAVMWMFAATLAVSLVFDYTDTARWLLGERDSML
ncbi:MAG: hypothetical protein KJP03_02880 [Gammaproteobacteria bacterium]|nr:hypothetical protein [Gammaproteobacteria bacterium]